MSEVQQTLLILKPDAVARNLIGDILRRCEKKGYVVREIKRMAAGRELLERHYEEHLGKPFYEPLVEFMQSGDVVAVRLEGHRVIEGLRSIIGATDPTLATAGTIRGDLGRDWGLKVQQNLVHASDSEASAARELKLWFN